MTAPSSALEIASPLGPMASPNWSSIPILVVDDNASKRLALKAVLVPLGCPVVEADCGLAALRCVMAEDFAVILLDVCMPVMDGFETAALIRQRRQSETTPIIFITAFDSEELVQADRYAEGAVDFIFAPVDPSELRAKVSAFMNLFIKSVLLATRADEAQTSADQLRLLTDAAPIGIFQTDTDNRYVHTNPRWSEITGISPEIALGQVWDIILDPGQRTRLQAELSDGADYRRELSRRFSILRPGEGPLVVVVTSVPIPDLRGGIAGWVGTVADVTAEAGVEAAMSKARDEATAASQLKSDFLANMSHEIRTPMNGVIGMTDLLLGTELDARQRDYAQTVRNSGEALMTIINDILDFSRIEAGKLEIEDIEFGIRGVVGDVIDLLAGSAHNRGLDLVASTASSVPLVVSGDPGRLRQVLTNLVGNAIKFTHTGEVLVCASQVETSGRETVIRFDVTDTGDGIAPDKLGVIFQPFVQADTSTSRRYGGTGLGLAISSQLVVLMGGNCGVSSVLGAGSSFWFTISVHADPAQAPEDLSAESGLSGARALVADDNATQRRVLSDYLSDRGMTVTAVASSPDALDAMRAAAAEGLPFAVALLDQSMPGMDEGTLNGAVESDPGLAGRLVLMTSTRHDGKPTDVGMPGLCAYLSKPVHFEDLLACVRSALGLATVGTPPVHVTARSTLAPGGTETGRLLLAEDNLINQKVAVAMLSSTNYGVDTVLNGAEAVQAAAAGGYDAILMDCQMPELNGYEATAAIRAQEGPARHTPIIALTASARQEDKERCLAAGMDNYLAKPLNKDALLAVLAQSITSQAVIHAGSDADITLDPFVFEELCALADPPGQDFVRQLVNQFVKQTEPRLVQLRQALAAGDTDSAGRVAHGIRGSSGQLGGRRLSSSCGRLEAKAATGGSLDVHTDMDEIEADYRELREALTQRLTSVGGLWLHASDA